MNQAYPLQFVSESRRRLRRTPLLWALVLALGACASRQSVHLGWWSYGEWGVAVLCLLSAVFVVRWLLLGIRLSPVALARQLDRELVLQARLESAVELQSETSALAEAQRADAAAHAQGHQTTRATGWFCAILATALVALLLGFEVSIDWIRLRHNFLMPQAAVVVAPQRPAVAPVPPPDYSGRILWRSPESEIKATSVEEVPLQAVAKSKVGYKKLTLEVAVNGEPQPSRVLEPAVLEAAAKPGTHALAASLFLDEAGVKDYDIVSYHLRGETSPGAPAILSPLQFVQIRPSREDIGEGGGAPNELLKVLFQLKTAQLELLKQNFDLAAVDSAREAADWREANAQLATDQEALSKKAQDLREASILAGMPPVLVLNLFEAAPLMKKAAAVIASLKNENAIKPQSQALALLAEVEQDLRKMMSEQSKGTPINDPFEDGQRFTLSEREEAPAGRLEDLARRQAEVARALNEAAVDQVAAQSDISRALAQLLAEHKLDPDVQSEVASASKDAADVIRQLAQNDLAAARGPAAAAAEALAHAAAEQERKGRQSALAELEKARRQLNENASESRSSERAAALRQLAGALAAAAEYQQQVGSAEAAARLAELSRSLRESTGGAPPAEGTAAKLAMAETELGGTPSALARAENQLERAQKALVQGPQEGRTNALRDGLMGAQLAEVVLADPAASVLARDIVSAIKADPHGGTGPESKVLGDNIHRLMFMVVDARARGRREEVVRRFNAADFDPAYRPAIEGYFEQLSREGAGR